MDYSAGRYLPVQKLTIGPAGPGDEQFEISLVEGPLLLLQFAAQRQNFLRRFPGSWPDIVCVDGVRAGRIWICRTGEQIHLLDLVIAPEYRNQGLGTRLIRTLLNEGKVVKLSVAAANTSAQRLYRRLGFRVIGRGDVYLQMGATPSSGERPCAPSTPETTSSPPPAQAQPRGATPSEEARAQTHQTDSPPRRAARTLPCR